MSLNPFLLLVFLLQLLELELFELPLQVFELPLLLLLIVELSLLVFLSIVRDRQRGQAGPSQSLLLPVR